jgi:hypothetical protein
LWLATFQTQIKALRKPDLVLKYRPTEWWRLFLYVAYYLGLRRGEILGLTWGHVSLETLEVHVLPAVLQRLARHAHISTTMGYYVALSADEIGPTYGPSMGQWSATPWRLATLLATVAKKRHKGQVSAIAPNPLSLLKYRRWELNPHMVAHTGF